VYPGNGGWRFLPIPQKEAAEIKEVFAKKSRGWGSLPVIVTIGTTTWETSIFPDKKSRTYLLPLKAQVRKKESLFDDDTVTYTVLIK
jgi:hypothetical protein